MKLKIILIVCMLVLISSVTGFTNCPSNADFEDAIRSAIVNYFRTHSEEDLNVLRDLIEFYSTHDLSTADCSEVGNNSGVEIQEAYKDAENVSEVIEDVDEKSVSLTEEVFSWVDDLLHSEVISNGLIRITLHSWSSDDFQFPISSNNLWRSGGMRFAVRYSGNLKWSHDGWIGSSIQTLPVTEDLHFTENTNDKKVAVGKVADSSVEVKTEATLLKDKKWMLIKYTLRNKGGSAVSNVKFYQGADFDVDHVTYSNDYGGYDSNLKLLYEWDSDGNPYVGFASSLSPAKHDVTQFRKIWDRISSDTLGDSNSYGMGDVGVAFRWDFGTLYPGETREIPLVLGAGTSLSNLKTEIQNGIGYVSPVQEPKLKLLFVPLGNWAGNQTGFDAEVKKQLDFFINDIPLKNCRDRVRVDIIDVNHDYDDFNCNWPTLFKLKWFVNHNTIYKSSDFDVVIGLISMTPCWPTSGESNGEDTIWLTTTYSHSLAHEMGHIYDLEDEYCSNQAGSTNKYCNDGDIQGDGSLTGDINYLDSALGCDPRGGVNCCEVGTLPNCDPTGLLDTGYRACCRGNNNSKGGIATMSYGDAHIQWPDWSNSPRVHDNHSLAHLNTVPQLRCD